MRRLLLDTHIWIKYVLGSKDLPSSIRTALDDAVGRCCLSPISLWEASLLIGKGRVRVEGGARAWIDRALESFPVKEVPLSFEVARTVESLALPHGDPGDHFLSATAIVHKLTLVTLDRNLVAAEDVPTLTA